MAKGPKRLLASWLQPETLSQTGLLAAGRAVQGRAGSSSSLRKLGKQWKQEERGKLAFMHRGSCVLRIPTALCPRDLRNRSLGRVSGDKKCHEEQLDMDKAQVLCVQYVTNTQK